MRRYHRIDIKVWMSTSRRVGRTVRRRIRLRVEESLCEREIILWERAFLTRQHTDCALYTHVRASDYSQ